MNDQSVLELLKTGKGFDALYAHYPPVEKMIYRNGGTRDDAKDVYQEALIILYRKVNTEDFKLTAKVSTYLFSVCRLLWLEQIRKRGKVPTDKMTEENDRDLQQEVNEETEKGKRLKQAEEALASLGEKCRKILQLFYFDKKSMHEIAKMLGYGSENSAKNQKYKCLETAKKKLEATI